MTKEHGAGSKAKRRSLSSKSLPNQRYNKGKEKIKRFQDVVRLMIRSHRKTKT